MDIKKATFADIEKVAPLFDSYRQFYEQKPDRKLAETYLHERMKNGDCTIFIACEDDSRIVGFTLLYPSFCSVDAQKTWVLYDLFVEQSERRKGVAEELLKAAQSFAQKSGAVWLKLETALTNIPGQKLYEKMGWERDNDFYTYFFHLPAPDEDTE